MDSDPFFDPPLCRGAISDEMPYIGEEEDIFRMDDIDFLGTPEVNQLDLQISRSTEMYANEGPSNAVTTMRTSFLPSPCGMSVPGTESRYSEPGTLSKSAPNHLGYEQIWQHREPRTHFQSIESLDNVGSTTSLSTDLTSRAASDFSLDETNDDSKVMQQEEAVSSDNDSGDDSDCDEICVTLHAKSASYKEEDFWQYKSKIKRQKEQSLKNEMKDPFCLKEVTDPVFSPDCKIQNLKYSGKVRIGKSNDFTLNPKLLLSIGEQLDALNKRASNITQPKELPLDDKPKACKDKSKLTSRVCRLKKKAQHEANKVILHGLNVEYQRTENSLFQVKQLIFNQMKNKSFTKENQTLTNASEKYVENANRLTVAGQTTEYVNKILKKTKSGALLDLDDIKLPNIKIH